MNTSAPPPDRPFEDPPSIEEAVRHHLDVIARLDTLERMVQAQLGRQVDSHGKLASLQSDVSRVMDAATSNGLMLERLERMLAELHRDVKRALAK